MIKLLNKMLGAFRMLRLCLWHPLRFKLHGMKYYLGKGAKVVFHKGKIELGKKVWLERNSTFEVNNGSLILGNNNFFNTNCKVVSLGKITIGNDNLFGPNVVIVDHNHRFTETTKPICKQGFEIREITLGSNIWIGANSTICAGVNICDNVVIGANSVVTKDINKSGVYVGNPVKLIRELDYEGIDSSR